MRVLDFHMIIKEAWNGYNQEMTIESITDISARVSTNHVYKVTLKDNEFVIAKLSYFGKFEHFCEDHTFINILANHLDYPFENFLARSLTKDNMVYTHRHTDKIIDAWVVFYYPMHIVKKLPKRLNENQIIKMGEQLALFHKSCTKLKSIIPPSSKTLNTDIDHLQEIVGTETGKYEHRDHDAYIKEQCELFKHNIKQVNYDNFDIIPVFVDWNIGNFSITPDGNFYSRWDYDWFRMSSRVMDFYFFSRVVSEIGDKSIFSYVITTLLEDRFLLFLQAYHKVFPLKKEEILFMKEAYRFFILNYVIKDGRYFFHEIYATRLQKEAYEDYLPMLDKKFNADKILKTLGL